MPTKPDLQSARRAAYAIWGLLRANPLNSETATKHIAGLIHSSAMDVYTEAIAEIETLEKAAGARQHRLQVWKKRVQSLHERCPGCDVAHERTHTGNCWVRVASGMATWRTTLV